eukprot:s153_g42.t1
MQQYMVEFPASDRVVNTAGQAPVFLHSYGNATGPCPCLCRASGFRSERLRQSGLRGVILPDQQGYRFLHPQEVSLLMGWPLDLHLGSDLRASLCLLGNLASPLQSLWIFAHLRNVLHQVWRVHDWVDPLQLLQKYKASQLFLRHHLWAQPETSQEIPMRLHTSEGVDIQFLKTSQMRVRDLLRAERINLKWGQHVHLVDGEHEVPVNALLKTVGFHGLCTLVTTTPMDLSCQIGLIAICIHFSEQTGWVFLPVGSFVWEALVALDFSHTLLLMDSFGQPWRRDDRVWASVELFGTLPVGAGTQVSLGLTLDFINWVLSTATDVQSASSHLQIPLHVVTWHGGLEVHYSSLPEHAWADWTVGIHLMCTLACGHWCLLACELRDLDFTVDFIDGLSHAQDPPFLSGLLQVLMDGWHRPCSKVMLVRGIHQRRSDSCGTLMLLHAGMILGLVDPADADSLESHHTNLLHLANAQGLHFGLSGHGFQPTEAQVILRLSQLLVEKGVPAARAEERASLGLKKIGVTEIQQALDNANPWAYLKAIASRPHVSFQWLKADELQQKIRATASKKFAIQPSEKRKQRGPKPKPAEPLWIDPAQLQLVPQTFFAQGNSLQQIAFTTVGPQATGLAFASVADLAPFLQAGKVISDGPLGILTTTPVASDQMGTLQDRALRFPAMFQATQEPVLIQGSLVTLGAVPIERGGDSVQCALDTIQTQTLRLAVFRDQFPDDWNLFMEQPVRSLLQRIPLLTLCKQSGCGVNCGRYHAALDEPLDNLILDLWARSWHRADSKFTKPKEAVMWTALIRVPASATRYLQALSGQCGLYIEPRSASGKEADSAFGIIWLGPISLQDAHHKLKTTKNAIAIGRINNKYGLRFLSDHLETAHQELKPDEQYTGASVQEIYKLYPLAWGTQRTALQKCLKDWGWKARVLQTVGGGNEGAIWEVGSSDAPPSSVLQSPDGDIVITHLRSATKDPKPVNVLASAATRRHLSQGGDAPRSHTDPKNDPWHQGGPDPWGGAAMSSTGSQDPAAADRWQQIEHRLQANMQDTIRKEIQQARQPMQGDDDNFKEQSNARFARLEASVTEIQAQQVKYDGWFAQMHQTDQFLSGQIEQANQRIDQVHNAVNTQVAALRDNMTQIHNDVSAGFANMEAMLSKRGKTS